MQFGFYGLWNGMEWLHMEWQEFLFPLLFYLCLIQQRRLMDGWTKIMLWKYDLMVMAFTFTYTRFCFRFPCFSDWFAALASPVLRIRRRLGSGWEVTTKGRRMRGTMLGFDCGRFGVWILLWGSGLRVRLDSAVPCGWMMVNRMNSQNLCVSCV